MSEENNYYKAMVSMLQIIQKRKEIQDCYIKIQENLSIRDLRRDFITGKEIAKAYKLLTTCHKTEAVSSSFTKLYFKDIDISIHNGEWAPYQKALSCIAKEVGKKNILNAGELI